MTQDMHSGYRRFERLFEAAYWLLAVGLAGFAWKTLGPGNPQLTWLFVISCLFGFGALMYFHVMPLERLDGHLAWRGEDKALLVSLSAVVLLTAYIRIVGAEAEPIIFAYFIPILLGTLLYEERLVLAESALAILALAFLTASGGVMELFSFASEARLTVFALVGLTALMLTTELRRRNDRSDALLKELSVRLDQIQVVSIIVRQIEFFSRLDTLIQRVTEILASAFSVARAGVLLTEHADGLLVPRGVYGATLSTDEVLACRRAYDTGLLVHAEGFMAVPLRLREERIGALCVAGKPGIFIKAESDFFELLGNYIAILIGNAISFQELSAERQQAEHMAQLMVSREIKMREMKTQLRENGKTL